MNGITVKLRRYKYTIQQWLMTPWHRYIMGRRIVHYIHVGKTGGTSVKVALLSFGRKTKTHYFCLHGHGFRLKDVPKNDIAIITKRNEFDRTRSVLTKQRMIEQYPLWKRLLVGRGDHRIQGWYWMEPIRCAYYVLDTDQLTDQFEILKQALGIPAWVKCGHANKSPKA